MGTITKERLAQLLAQARATAAAAKLKDTEAVIANIQEQVTTDTLEVDLSGLGITGADELLEEEADVLMECIAAEAEPYRNPVWDEHDRELEAQFTQEEKDVDITEEQIESAVHTAKILGVTRDNLTYNTLQQEGIDEVAAGKDVVIIGKAGTGKTTSMRGAMKALMRSGKVGKMTTSTKWLHSVKPGCAIVSYTRKAVNNIRHAMPEELKAHTITLHKLLEFKPTYYEILDDTSGKMKKTMRFEPSRCAANPLPSSLTCIAFEESSMIGVDLHQQLLNALPHECQMIYLGDIQQLPPVFGSAILGFKMLELKVVELTEVYRQALESPILRFALSLLDGDVSKYDPKIEKFEEYHPVFKKVVPRIRVPSLDKFASGDELVMQVWQKRLKDDVALFSTVQQFNFWADAGYYNPDDDIILLPFNKSFGTVELNKGIMQHLGRKRKAIVHEIIAGFNKFYLAEGDRVLYDKEDAIIINIESNDEYIGKRTMPASRLLDRWGHMREDDAELAQMEASEQKEESDAFNLEAIEKFMNSAAKDIEERTAAASHAITLRVPTSDQDVEISKAAEVNSLLGGYAITVHKSQGSEWDKVFFIMHQSHAVMNQRELLYTACTRAAKRLHIICEPDTFYKGVASQAIKGNTLAEKAEYFKGKQESFKDRLVASEIVEGAVAQESSSAPATTPVIIPASSNPPVKLIRMCEFVSESFKQTAFEELCLVWNKAHAIWGDNIGPRPVLDYNLQRSSIIGMACYQPNQIKLNPVWCIIADKDERAMEKMLKDTLVHEVAHFVAHRYSRERGHNAGWIMAMKLLGIQNPQQYYTGDALPGWTASFKDIQLLIEADLRNKGADFFDDTVVSNDDEV